MKIIEPLSCQTTANNCLRGHFPGKPVVPGAYILSLVAQTTRNHFPNKRIITFDKAKFIKTLTPETDKPELTLILGAENTLKFSISSTEGAIMTGKATLTDV